MTTGRKLALLIDEIVINSNINGMMDHVRRKKSHAIDFYHQK